MRYITFSSSLLALVVAQNQFAALPFDHTIELVWVQDLSSSFQDDMPNMLQQYPDVIDELKWTFPHSKFALASFVDKPLEPFGFAVSKDYCYQLRYRLTRYTNRLRQSLEGALIHSGGDWPESQLHALLAAAKSNETHWTADGYTPNGYKIHKIIMLVTDAGFHKAGDSKLKPNDGDGNVDCLGEDYPTIQQVKDALNQENILPIFLTTKEVAPLYRRLVKDLGDNGVVGVIDQQSKDLRKQVINALKVAFKDEAWTKCGNGGDCPCDEEEDDCPCHGEDCCQSEHDCYDGSAVVIHLEQIPKKLSLNVDH